MPKVVSGRPDLGFLPYVVLADGGFGLKDYMLVPFNEIQANTEARRAFNTRLSSYEHLIQIGYQ